MVIYGPRHAEYDIDLGPIMLGDYHHESYESIVEAVTSVTNDSSKYVPKSDNTLIQGLNPYNCSLATNGTKCNAHAPYAMFNFQSGKSYRLRLINAGAAAVIRFSIDGHTLQVIANDFTPIVPYETNVVTLGVGQRSDVIVKAIGNSSQSFWMRGTQALNCTSTSSPYGKAVVLYEHADISSLPTTAPYFLPELNCANVSSVEAKRTFLFGWLELTIKYRMLSRQQRRSSP
jgi:FtsP/CotA-like multicopper oxidase with cupredoxin domain